MKYFLLLSVLSVTAYAACEEKMTNCETNYRCAEQALRSGQAVDTYTNWSNQHGCNDELKFAALFASLDGELEDISYSTAKTDLPVIEDARDRAPAQSKE